MLLLAQLVDNVVDVVCHSHNCFKFDYFSFWLLNTTTIEGNGAELLEPPNFRRPLTKRISALW